MGTRSWDRQRRRLREEKVEGQSPVSQWAPSKMGVPAQNLGSLSGPHEEMAPEARMEMWSLSRTTSLRLSTPGPQRKPIPAPYTAQRTDSVTGNPALDPQTSRAQEDCVLTSSPMELRHRRSQTPVDAGSAWRPKGERRHRVAFFDKVRHLRPLEERKSGRKRSSSSVSFAEPRKKTMATTEEA